MIAHLEIVLAVVVAVGGRGDAGRGPSSAGRSGSTPTALVESAPGGASQLAAEASPAAEAAPVPHFEDADSDTAAAHGRMRVTVDEVLARPEFRDLHADPNAFWRWLLGWLSGLVETIRGLPSWLVWVVVGWMLVTLVAILVHLVYTLWTILGGSAGVSRAGAGGRRHAGELLGIRDLEFDSVYAEARRLLEAGQWLAATKYLYVAAILWLDRQGWIAFRPAKTNRDYLAELRAFPAGAPAEISEGRLGGPFRQLTETFERIAYGGQPASDATTRDMATTVEGMLLSPAQAMSEADQRDAGKQGRKALHQDHSPDRVQ